MKYFLRRNIISGLVLGCLVFPLVNLGYANPVDPEGPPPTGGFSQPPRLGEKPDFIEHIEASLTKLVSDGTITLEQKTALVKFFKEKDKERKAAQEKKHNEMLQELIGAGQLTSEQAQAIDEALRPPLAPYGPEGLLPPNHPSE